MNRTAAARTSAYLPVVPCTNIKKINGRLSRVLQRMISPSGPESYLIVLDAGRRQDTSRCLDLLLGHPNAELLAAFVHFICKSFNLRTEDKRNVQ